MDAADVLLVSKVRDWCSSGDARLLREQARLSQGEVAGAVESVCGLPVNASYVSLWERGEKLPSGERAVGLAKVLGALTVGDDA
jgi:transcriptional regulator with XRE-family HTH domain